MVAYYDMVGSYTLQRAVPSLIARPETLIHGQEVRVYTGAPPDISTTEFTFKVTPSLLAPGLIPRLPGTPGPARKGLGVLRLHRR